MGESRHVFFFFGKYIYIYIAMLKYRGYIPSAYLITGLPWIVMANATCMVHFPWLTLDERVTHSGVVYPIGVHCMFLKDERSEPVLIHHRIHIVNLHSFGRCTRC